MNRILVLALSLFFLHAGCNAADRSAIPCNPNLMLPKTFSWSYCSQFGQLVSIGKIDDSSVIKSSKECNYNRDCSKFDSNVCVNEESGRSRFCYKNPLLQLPSVAWVVERAAGGKDITGTAMTKIVLCSLFALVALVTISQVHSAVLPISSTELATVPHASSEETSVDTLGSSRVKRSGGCGCCGCGCCGCGGGGGGCGCCCCRPRCCCRCTCCRTCCCTRCCTCCRPCCCGCGCGCGCCGCGGGGRKRRSLQNLRIDEANRALGIKRRPSGTKC
ncbi:unnamed protein product [Caenorhabditis sp. 36 PRJEB53466]|nr:unnamed protein product [Caenorhabditis sp. 36 PRJEB53466]